MTTFAVPTSSEELEELLNDDARMKTVWKEGKFGELTKNYLAATAKANNGELENQLREQLQLGLTQFMRENGSNLAPRIDLSADGAPDVSGVPGYEQVGGGYGWARAQARKQALYNKKAAGAKLNGTFDNVGGFLRGLANEQAGLRTRDHDELETQFGKVKDIQNSFGTNVPADGGFLIPEEFRSDLLMVALESAIVRPRATVIPMSSQTLAIPAVDVTSNATTLFGGIQTYWVDESTQPTESSAKFAQVKLDAKKLMAYCTAPNELVSDPSAFGAFIDQTLPKAVAFEEDYRFMQGTGVGEPLGFINCPAAVIATAVSGQGSGTILVDNLAALYARMLPSSLMNAIWVASIDTFPQLALMAVQGSLGNSTPVWMNNGVQGGPPVTIYGRPVYFTEKAATLGTTGDINFVDPSFYLIGDRQAVTASASPHFAFNVDKTAYKIIERVDGRPWLQSAITPKNGGNTLSAFVQLSSTRT